MIVAGKVKHRMQNENSDLLRHRVPKPARIKGCNLGRNSNIASEAPHQSRHSRKR